MVRALSISIAVLLSCVGCRDPESQKSPSTSSSAGATTSSASTIILADPSLRSATVDASLDVSSVIDAAPDDVPPALYEADGAALGQTDAFPSVDSPSYRARLSLLFAAIVDDDADAALPAFFPLVAYEQVKAIPNAAADWKSRLIGAFSRDVHKYHQALGEGAKGARLLRLDVPIAKAKWMEPGSEGNKLGYDRVLDSKLVYALADGKERTLDVKSMISWRGEWYVVHLAGFK